MNRGIIALGCLLTSFVPFLAAQEPKPDFPPLSMPEAPLPPPSKPMPGLIVSQALQPVPDLPPLPPAPQPPLSSTPPAPELVRIPGGVPLSPLLPRFWVGAESWIGFYKPQPLLPLVSGNSAGNNAVLGTSNTALLIGQKNTPNQDIPGSKFTLGAGLGEARIFGLEVSYFYLAALNTVQTTGSIDPSAWPSFGVPLRNATTGAEDVVNLRMPMQDGYLKVFTNSRVQGWEALGMLNFFEGGVVRLHALAGYRYLQLNETLRIETNSNAYNPGTPDIEESEEFPQGRPGTPPNIFDTNTYDQVDTRNRFHGGLLGLRTSANAGPLFCEFDSKVALGSVQQSARRSGLTVGTRVDQNGAQTLYFPSGIFVQPTNSGQFQRNAFAVLPEGNLKLGFSFRRYARVYVGYTVLYLSDVLRPADQLDRTVDLSTVNTGAISATGRPSPALVKGDFWVQAVTLGLEWRY